MSCPSRWVRDADQRAAVGRRRRPDEATGDLVMMSWYADRVLPGRSHEHLAQHVAGIRVHGGGVSRQLDRGVTVSLLGTLYRDVEVETAPALSPGEAAARIAQATGESPAAPPRLVILPWPDGRYALAYRTATDDGRKPASPTRHHVLATVQVLTLPPGRRASTSRRRPWRHRSAAPSAATTRPWWSPGRRRAGSSRWTRTPARRSAGPTWGPSRAAWRYIETNVDTGPGDYRSLVGGHRNRDTGLRRRHSRRHGSSTSNAQPDVTNTTAATSART